MSPSFCQNKYTSFVSIPTTKMKTLKLIKMLISARIFLVGLSFKFFILLARKPKLKTFQWFTSSWFSAFFLAVGIVYVYRTNWNFIHLIFWKSFFSQNSYSSLKFLVFLSNYRGMYMKTSCLIGNQLSIQTHILRLKRKKLLISTKLSITVNPLKINHLWNEMQTQLKLHRKTNCKFKTDRTPIYCLNKYKIHFWNWNNIVPKFVDSSNLQLKLHVWHWKIKINQTCQSILTKTKTAKQSIVTERNGPNTVVQDDSYRLEKNQIIPSTSKKVKSQQVVGHQFSICNPFIFRAVGKRRKEQLQQLAKASLKVICINQQILCLWKTLQW